MYSIQLSRRLVYLVQELRTYHCVEKLTQEAWHYPMALLHCVEIEAMEIEVLCSELEWGRPIPARDTTIEELRFPGES